MFHWPGDYCTIRKTFGDSTLVNIHTRVKGSCCRFMAALKLTNSGLLVYWKFFWVSMQSLNTLPSRLCHYGKISWCHYGSNCLPIPLVVSIIWHGTWCHQVVYLLVPVNMGHCSSPMQRYSPIFTKTINEEHKHQPFCSFCMGACVYLDNIWDPLWWISHASVRFGGEKTTE